MFLFRSVSVNGVHARLLTEPLYDSVGAAVASPSGPVVFHSEVGANIRLSNGRRTATRVR